MALNISKDILYAGVEDRDIDLFEGQYPVPDGITYNSYIIRDARTAVMDAVDGRFAEKWLAGVEAELGGKTPDYIVVHHMEPDHSAGLGLFMDRFPETKVVMMNRDYYLVEETGEDIIRKIAEFDALGK